MLVCLQKDGKRLSSNTLFTRITTDLTSWAVENTEWKTIVWDEKSESLAVPNGSIGFRWDKSAKWNLETKAQGDEIEKQQLLI